MKRSIDWFIDNPIAANLLMILIIVGGIVGMRGIGKEVFPTIPVNYIQISMPYPGAGPREVEEQIVIRIEEAIYNLDGIKRISSSARQGSGRVSVEVDTSADMSKVLNDIKGRVDAITTFPVDAERPIVSEQLERNEVIRVAIAGDVDELVLKHYGELVRDQLAALPGVDTVDLWGVPERRFSVELSEVAIRRFGLSFDQVVSAIRRSSLNLPAGTVRATDGDLQIQTRGQAYTPEQFYQIPLFGNPDGTQLMLGDVATVYDTFAETSRLTRFNGQKAIFLGVYVGKQPDIVASTDAVKTYVANAAAVLPDGLSAGTWLDMSGMYKGRLELLSTNAFGGLILVFITLMLFLRPLLAMWVAAGIAIAYMGALWLLPGVGLTLNMLSMFAFLLILGIIVDDAIVVGESIYSYQQQGYSGTEAARLGAQAVAKPVTLAVISTMVVFAPMLLLPGVWPKIIWAIPMVTIVALTFSLIESFYILPSHLAHMGPEREPTSRPGKFFHRVRMHCVNGLTAFGRDRYQPFLALALEWRALTLVVFTLGLVLSLSLVGAGYIKQSFMPNVASDFIFMRIDMPSGHPSADKEAITLRGEAAVQKLLTDPLLTEQIDTRNMIKNQLSFMFGDNIRLALELQDNVSGDISPALIGERWQHHIGEVPEARSFTVDASITRNVPSSSVLLTSNNLDQLSAAAHFVKEQAALLPGARNIRDNIHSGRYDLDINLLPSASLLGVGLSDVARQVRQAFYGAEAQRVPLGRDDIRVMVRYPQADRERVDTLDDLRVRLADGTQVPFYTVAETDYVPGYSRINRQDRQRSVKVSVSATKGELTLAEISTELYGPIAEELHRLYPAVNVVKDGDQREEEELGGAIAKFFFLSLGIMYLIMAVEFRSYLKPFGILVAVPFGIMGALFGHLLLGLEVSFMSFIGVLAAAGVVVNDNLVLLDRVCALRDAGNGLKASLLQAAGDRFRPILLTSITTFAGLAPIMAETSMQARFLIPMVVSLAFGVLFATLVTLILVPCLYYVGARCVERLRPGTVHGVRD